MRTLLKLVVRAIDTEVDYNLEKEIDIPFVLTTGMSVLPLRSFIACNVIDAYYDVDNNKVVAYLDEEEPFFDEDEFIEFIENGWTHQSSAEQDREFPDNEEA